MIDAPIFWLMKSVAGLGIFTVIAGTYWIVERLRAWARK